MTEPKVSISSSVVTENRHGPGPSGNGCTAGQKPGILVVDDEQCLRDMLKIAFGQRGFSAWLAADGWEALELYEHHRAAIDMVLMDVRMPGLDGLLTLGELRQLDPDVRCCFMSGDLGGYTERRLRESGAAAVFHKPFNLDEVFLALSKLYVPGPESAAC
jgi:CheY-like chemotaxis protein